MSVEDVRQKVAAGRDAIASAPIAASAEAWASVPAERLSQRVNSVATAIASITRTIHTAQITSGPVRDGVRQGQRYFAEATGGTHNSHAQDMTEGADLLVQQAVTRLETGQRVAILAVEIALLFNRLQNKTEEFSTAFAQITGTDETILALQEGTVDDANAYLRTLDS